MTTSANSSEARQAKRWWLRFSLRSLLLFTALTGLLLMPLAIRLQQAAEVRSHIREIQKSGGSVGFIDHSTPTWARMIFGDEFFSEVDHVSFSRFSGYPTDDDVEHLAGFKKIKLLWLERSGITDEALRHLDGFESLEILNLAETQITDAGLAHLKHLSNLKDLALWDTRITDVGLEHLTELNHLEHLRLQGTDVTEEGVKTLQQALPDCGIYR